MINSFRIKLLHRGNSTGIGPVIYWMSRDQRAHDNWALLFAQQLSFEKNRGLVVIFNLVNEFLEASIRQYGFMLKGLQEAEKELAKYNIPFVLLSGKPEINIPSFIKDVNASALITDFDPLKIKLKWQEQVRAKIQIPYYIVDTHNIVPAWHVSGKQEFGAYTIRPKINRLLPEFLEDFPLLSKMKKSEALSFDKTDWVHAGKSLKINYDVKEVNRIKPGSKEAQKTLNYFLREKINNYASQRNDPNKNAQSNLSPYLHFGQISAQRIALETKEFDCDGESKNAFLEELIVRRELSDNYCYYNKNYDAFEGFPKWAQGTLNKHKKDKREFIYTLKEFEEAKTHEDLWNAAQKELLYTGKLHGYMRMYWGKKILEWSKSPEEALRISIYLNDKYSLDGRDPNGYTGCAWSIGGVHDRAWAERGVFGQIRYMNRNGAKRKFDVDEYVKKHAIGN
ncbi:MAG: deoxyribodipyrimidine photo-lyase [Ignavibacteriaceae bacterium]